MDVQELELPVCAVIRETIYIKPEIVDSENDEDIGISENIYIKLENTEEPISQEHTDTLKEVPPKENNPTKIKGQSHPKIKNIESSADKNEALSEDEKPNKSKKGKKSRNRKSKTQKNDISVSPDDVLSATDIIKYIELVQLTEEERQAEHLAAVGRLETGHVCDGCALGFSLEEDYAAHLKLHSDEHGTVECDVCLLRFDSATSVEKHRSQHFARHRCMLCRAVLGDYELAASHVAREHVGRVRCPVCDRGFKRAICLSKHIERSGACGKLCNGRAQLSKHMSAVALTARCPHCERVCSNRQMLKRHMARMHAPGREKKFECDHCGSRFMTKAEAREHISWTHMGARRAHACRCGRVFRTPARRRAHHAAAHMRQQPAKDHHCDVCNKAFPSNSEMNRHKRTHADTRYPCLECGETFKTRSYVIIHHKLKHMHMTRDDIRQQNREKREQRMREIATAHRKKFKVVFSEESEAKNVRDKIGCVSETDTSDNGVRETKDICIPMFDTFVDVLIEND